MPRGSTASVIQELLPGVRGIEIPAAYDIRQYSTHNGAVAGGDEPTVRSHDTPWSFMASFPAQPQAFVAPGEVSTIGWVTRVTCELTAGSCTLSHATADFSRLSGEIAVRTGCPRVDVLLETASDGASLMVRRGADAGATEMTVSGFQTFCLVDDDGPLLAPPPGGAIRPMPRWSRFYGAPGDDLSDRVRDLRYRRFAGPRPMRWVDGLEVLLAPDEQISRAVFVSGTYEPCTAAVLHRLLGEGDTFVDVGANIGLFTMLAARWVGPRGRVLALEPSRREFERLRHHLERNRLVHAEAVPVAAGDRNGRAVLHVAPAQYSGLNTIEDRFVYASTGEAYSEAVPVARLDDLLPRHGIARVDTMKVDVEGSEHRVIAGALETLARDRPTLILERVEGASPPSTRARTSIEALLASLDYRLAAIDGESGTVVPADDLSRPVENFVAATPAVMERLMRPWRVHG